ncbi:MAG: NYN domain-containing protein [Candidatus Aenigmatarchaeota archaeon]
MFKGEKITIILIILIMLFIANVRSSDPGHLAESISSGTFEGGNYIFPNNLTVIQNLSAGSVLWVDSSGKIGVATTSPSSTLHVIGGICAESSNTGCVVSSGYVRGSGLCIAGDCITSWSQVSTPSGWVLSGEYLYNNTDNVKVGIGTSSPVKKFEVIGDINSTGILYGNQLNILGGYESGGLTIDNYGNILTHGNLTYSGYTYIIDVLRFNGTIEAPYGVKGGYTYPGICNTGIGCMQTNYYFYVEDSVIKSNTGFFVNGDLNATGTIYEGGSSLSNKYVSRGDWTTIDNYPEGCGVGQAVQAIGDTLVCIDVGGGGNLYGSGSSGYLAMWNATNTLNDSVIYQYQNKIGIGTTSPSARLNIIASTSDSSANALIINQSSGTQIFSVRNDGLCVSGDTKLRRKKKKSDDYEEVKIKDIKEGDEIASLDEATGKIVWRRVKKLIDMGIKPVYRIVTEDGRSIETTATHPYLVLNPGNRKIKHKSDIKNAGWLRTDQINIGDYIAVTKPRVAIFIDDANMFYAQRKAGWKINYKKFKDFLEEVFDVVFMNYHIAIPSTRDSSFLKTKNYLDKLEEKFGSILTFKKKHLKYINDGDGVIKKGGVDTEITIDVLSSLEKSDVVIILSGDSDYVSLARNIIAKGKKVLFMGFKKNMAWEIRQLQHVYFENIRNVVEDAPELETGVPLPNSNYKLQVYKAFSPLLYPKGSPKDIWLEKDVDFIWAKVVKIESVGEEHVYDIEVEDTHNFIGNDILAHNTYIYGNVGIGTTSPMAKVEIQGSGTDGLSLNVTDDLFVNETSGNVGIGTSYPTNKLEVSGSIKVTSSSTTFTIDTNGDVIINLG